MSNLLFPKSIDNTFRGQKVALWLLTFILIIKTAQSVFVLFDGANILSSADGIPLETYSPSAAQTIVSMGTGWGFTRLVISLLGFLVLFRYRAMVPTVFLLLLVHDAGRQIIFYFIPIQRAGATAGPAVNFVLMLLTIAGLFLSILPKRNRLDQ